MIILIKQWFIENSATQPYNQVARTSRSERRGAETRVSLEI